MYPPMTYLATFNGFTVAEWLQYGPSSCMKYCCDVGLQQKQQFALSGFQFLVAQTMVTIGRSANFEFFFC